MKTTIEQIEEVMIMQMRALDSRVSVEAAQALHELKLHLINQYHHEQLIKHADSMIRPSVWQRVVFWFKIKRS